MRRHPSQMAAAVDAATRRWRSVNERLRAYRVRCDACPKKIRKLEAERAKVYRELVEVLARVGRVSRSAARIYAQDAFYGRGEAC